MVMGVLITYVQSQLDVGVGLLWRRDAWLELGLVQGLGAMAADTLKSFFKRRIGIVPGKPWVPADQLDFVIGALIPLATFVPLSAADVLAILVFTFVGDILRVCEKGLLLQRLESVTSGGEE